MYRDWTSVVVLTACLLVFAGQGSASPEIRATGRAWPSDDPAFEGYWEYCYEIHWAGLPHGVSHLGILLCPPGDCDCGCRAEFFAFADTTGWGETEEEPFTVHYFGGLERPGDPSTGLEGMLLKFEPYESMNEPGLEGCAFLCFYCVAAPVTGNYPDQISIKFGGEYALADLDGPLPGCRQGFSRTDIKTWGYVKTVFR